ncbi:MAG: methyltransferase domain-containing protein [Nitrospirae bacterium]|nr:methyltransferase domain-containing protein [Magnetococcales bacterium]
MRSAINLEHLESSNLGAGRFYRGYVELLVQDIVNYFQDRTLFQKVPCPGCGGLELTLAYEKMGFAFERCLGCGSIFVNPRPDEVVLDEFNRSSSACRYWRRETLGLTEIQLNHLHGPNIQWLSELMDERFEVSPTLLDYGSSSPYFLNRAMDEFSLSAIVSFRPQLFECQSLAPSGIIFMPEWRDIPDGIDMITAFHSIERMADCRKFFTWAGKNCRKNGLLLLTTTTCSGFEYQVLGEHASNINPINRMNLLSLEALTDQIVAAGFEIVELSTPGRLDVEIVRSAMAAARGKIVEPFWEYLLHFRDEQTFNNLQTFLQMNRLSSFVRIAACKL